MTKCKDCTFWVRRSDSRRFGTCHAKSPGTIIERGVLSTAPHHAYWPTTCDYDQCGEGEPKEDVEVRGDSRGGIAWH